MPYFRLIKETDTQIHISNKGIEEPGVECIHINNDDPGPKFKMGDGSRIFGPQVRTLTFEDGRTEEVFFEYAVRHREYVLSKRIPD